MKNLIIFFLLLFLFFHASAQSEKEPLLNKKYFVSKDTIHTLSRYPQRKEPFTGNMDSLKADHKRRTGKEFDTRYPVAVGMPKKNNQVKEKNN